MSFGTDYSKVFYFRLLYLYALLLLQSFYLFYFQTKL